MSKLSVEAIKGNGIVRQVKRAKVALKIEKRNAFKDCAIATVATEIGNFTLGKLIPGGKLLTALLKGTRIIPTAYSYARYDKVNVFKEQLEKLEKSEEYQAILKRHVSKTLKENFGYLA